MHPSLIFVLCPAVLYAAKITATPFNASVIYPIWKLVHTVLTSVDTV